MIKVDHLVKYYGDFKAVDDLSFEIENGSVYGFLGPNGAGKSTTMNIMTGCLSATSGTVTIGGHDIFEEAKEAKKLIGYLPEIPPLYLDSTPREYLSFVASVKGIGKKDIKWEVDRVIEETGLVKMQNRLCKHLSKGYKQRVGIAQAILGNPEVIILDEPTVGLDPMQMIEIRELIKQLSEKHTVILSSHILSEVQMICDKVLIIAHGKLLAFDEPQNLQKYLQESSSIKLEVDANKEDAERILTALPFITKVTVNATEDGSSCEVNLNIDDMKEAQKKISLAFAKEEKVVYQMTPVKASLEDIFIELTQEEAPVAKEAEAPIKEEKEVADNVENL